MKTEFKINKTYNKSLLQLIISNNDSIDEMLFIAREVFNAITQDNNDESVITFTTNGIDEISKGLLIEKLNSFVQITHLNGSN